MDRAYERYSLELRSVQILYSKSGKHNATQQRTELPEQAILFTRWLFFEGEKWKNARLEGFSHQHILQPMDFTLQLAKCMVDKDSRMPRLAFALYRMSLLFLTHALISVPFQVQSIRGAAVTSCEDL